MAPGGKWIAMDVLEYLLLRTKGMSQQKVNAHKTPARRTSDMLYSLNAQLANSWPRTSAKSPSSSFSPKKPSPIAP